MLRWLPQQDERTVCVVVISEREREGFPFRFLATRLGGYWYRTELSLGGSTMYKICIVQLVELLSSSMDKRTE